MTDDADDGRTHFAMTPSEIFLLAKLTALEDAWLMMAANLSAPWPEDMVQAFGAALRAGYVDLKAHDVPADVSELIDLEHRNARERLFARLVENRAMVAAHNAPEH